MAMKPWALSQLFIVEIVEEAKILAACFWVVLEKAKKDIDSMASCVLANYSIPTLFDIRNFLRVEEVSSVDVVAFIARAGPTTDILITNYNI